MVVTVPGKGSTCSFPMMPSFPLSKESCTVSVMQCSVKGSLLADVVLQSGILLIACFACLSQFLILQISVQK